MAADIVQRLRGYCIDWTGEPIVDGSAPRVELHCAEIREAATEIESLRAERDEAINNVLRMCAAELAAVESANALRARVGELEADLKQRDDLLILAEKFRLSRDMTVESRGPSQWAVCDCGMVLTDSGVWVYEPLPSSRTEAFIASTRFSFADAITRARAALTPEPPHVDI